jgi:DNA-binding LacI/PurR family transcriptional regulator
MRRHGLRDDRVVVAEAYSEPAGRTAMLEILRHVRPTAVVAGNDLLAIGCSAWRRRGCCSTGSAVARRPLGRCSCPCS